MCFKVSFKAIYDQHSHVYNYTGLCSIWCSQNQLIDFQITDATQQ